MNGYYNFKDGLKIDYYLEYLYEKELFLDAIKDRLLNPKRSKFYGCEIGVLYGETSFFFLREFENLYLTGIDPLIPDSMESSLIGNFETIEKNIGIYKDRWQFYQDYSFNIHNKFKNESFDFVFIDGDHTYNAVSQDFELYLPKVKNGGLVFMHDSRMNRGGANFHVGSSQFADHIIENDSRVTLVGEAFSLTCFIKN